MVRWASKAVNPGGMEQLVEGLLGRRLEEQAIQAAVRGGELAGNGPGQAAADAAGQLGGVGAESTGIAKGLEDRLQITNGYALGQELLEDLVNLGDGKLGVVV